MKNKNLYDLFIIELKDMLSCEEQIIEFLPLVIKSVSLPDLKDALTKHLKETENQVTRIEKIFSILGASQAKEQPCIAMEGIIREAHELIKNNTKSPILDAAIIGAAQKIEHYEVASYGTLRSYAKHLDFSSEIIDLLQDSLDEEGSADKKLTKIADGSFFFSGVNEEAAAGRNRL